GAEQLARHVSRGDCFLGGAAPCGVREHLGAELLDQRPEALAGPGTGRFAPERDGDDLRARRFNCLLQAFGRWILRGPEQKSRGEGRAVESEHQPPCLGATISTSAASMSGVLLRSEAATKLPFTAVAILASAKPKPAQSSSRFLASVAKRLPLSRICNKHLRMRLAGRKIGGDKLGQSRRK